MGLPPNDNEPPDDNGKSRADRMAALQKALEHIGSQAGVSGKCAGHDGTGRADSTEHKRPRATPLAERRVAERDLIDEINSAARGIADARDWNGDPVYRTDGIWRVLATVARSPYCLAIADLGRALRVRKQAARELVHAAVRARLIELAPNPQDKRILQLFVTPSGRSELAAAEIAEDVWLAALLHGLGDRELKATIHVVRIVRQRLERDAGELERQKRGRAR